MYLILMITFLSASNLAYRAKAEYSYSPAVGRGSGHSFSLEGQGRITGVRVWEHQSAYIAGIQLAYDHIWSHLAGKTVGEVLEMKLFDDERITQVSGKYHTSNFIYQLYIATSRGRFLVAGQPTSLSFNMYPTHSDAQLIMLSGRYDHWGITALAAHWDVVKYDPAHSASNSSLAG